MASDFDQLPDNSLEAAEYRSLSPVAILGLVLGLLSPLALVTPFLMPLPVVAVLLSWIAARSIRKSPETKAGFGLALAGLGLSVAVLGAIYARGYVATILQQSAAERVAAQFLKRLRSGDIAGAYDLKQEHHKRLPTAEAAAIFYEANEEAAQQLAEFADNPAVRCLASGDDPKILRRLEVQKLRYGKFATGIVYRTSEEGAAEEKQREVSLILERSSPRASRPAWRVTNFEFADLVGSGG